MLQTTSLTARIAALVAAIMLAVPSVAFTCACNEPQTADDTPAETSQQSCCCQCPTAPQDDAARAGNDDSAPTLPCSDDDRGPCDCPYCPAACCGAKLQCPPIDVTASNADLSPEGELLHLVDLPPVDAPAEGIFHPPRI